MARVKPFLCAIRILLCFLCAMSVPLFAAQTVEDAQRAIRQKQFSIAAEILTPLAQNGDTVAAYYLGSLYRAGNGVERDDRHAFRLFEQAASDGDAKSQYSLANLYEHGWGVRIDRANAVEWYRRAAENGSRQAKVRLQFLQEGSELKKHDGDAQYRRAVRSIREDNVDALVELIGSGLELKRRNVAGETLLATAILLDAQRCVEVLMRQQSREIPVNLQNESALSLALRIRNLDMFTVLAAAGAVVDHVDGLGMTPLHRAVMLESTPVVRSLLDSGVKLDIANSDGLTAFDLAVARGLDPIASLLAAAGAVHSSAYQRRYATTMGRGVDLRWLEEQRKKLLVDGQADAGWPLLHVAIHQGKPGIVGKLLAKGISPLELDSDGTTALERAIESGRDQIFFDLFRHTTQLQKTQGLIGRLLAQSFEYNRERIGLHLLDDLTRLSGTAAYQSRQLYAACAAGHERAMIKMLAGGWKNFATGGEVSAHDDADSKQVYFCVCRKGYRQALLALERLTPFINKRDTEGKTGLWLALESGHSGLLPVLLSAGADPNTRDARGASALMLAAQQGDLQAVQWLLEKGASVDSVNAEGQTALMVAAIGAHADIVRQIVEQGADIDTRSEASWTALMLASDHGHLSVVKILVGHGAKVSRRDRKGRDALVLAQRRGHTQVVNFLRQQG